MSKTNYHIYEESLEGLTWVHNLKADSPRDALDIAVEKGSIPSNEEFVVIADSNHNDLTSPERGPV